MRRWMERSLRWAAEEEILVVRFTNQISSRSGEEVLTWHVVHEDLLMLRRGC